MTFIKQNIGLLRSVRGLGALGLLLALVVSAGIGSGQGQTNCVIPPTGMVAWYPLDELTGANAVNDIAPPPGSVVNNVGTPMPGPIGPPGPGSGPAPVAGQVNGALQFDIDYVEVPDNAELNFGQGPFTIDAWVKPQQGQQIEPIVAKLDAAPSGTKTGYFLFIQSGGLALEIGNGSSIQLLTGPSITPGQWNFVAAVVSPPKNEVILYVGVSTTFTGTLSAAPNTTNTKPLHIGRSPYNPHANGITIDELELFNRALSPQEIQDIYNAGSAGKCKGTADLGDAPDSTNHAGATMTTYTSVTAKFPTVFDPTTGLPQGPKHLQPKGLAWLGPDVSFENEADLLPDSDTVTNIGPSGNAADQDKYDDGVALPISIPACAQIAISYTVKSSTSNPIKMYLNVWFDFNRDGDWDDIQKCPLGPSITGLASEWSVQNEVVTAPGTFTTPLFTTMNPGQPMWMRVTLSEQPAPAGTGNPDGRGPASGYQYGETEDYLVESKAVSELCGVKFHDLNGNGVQDSGEPGLPNWVITVTGPNGIVTAVTDMNGQYCIAVPVAGTYTVSEQQQAGWTQTAPASGTYTVTVPPAHTNLNFGNRRSEGTICVLKFEDLDGDGVQDPGESLLAGWQFNVTDQNNNSVGTITTSPPGTPPACLTVAAPGTYTITEQVQSGWTPTTQNPQTVTVSPGQLVNVFFGNKREGKCDLAIRKTVTPTPTALVQVTITLTVPAGQTCAPGTVVVGDQQPTGMTFTLPNSLVVTPAADWNCSATTSSNLSCTNIVTLTGVYTATFTFTSAVQPGIKIENCATATVSGQLISKSCVPVQVGKCDLAIRKSVSPNPVNSGQQVTITLTVQNVGTAPCPPGPQIFGTGVQDPRPLGLTFTAPPGASQPGWQCSLGIPTGDASCGAPGLTLPLGYTVTFTITATVTAPAGSQIQNCATVTNQNDTNPANNQSCVVINVTGLPPPPDLFLRKSRDGNLVSGKPMVYLIVVSNSGQGPTTGPTKVTDVLPQGLAFISATGSGWQCSASGQTVVCLTNNTINPKTSAAPIQLRVNVTAQPGTQITNCATVETVGDTNPANNRGCDTGTVQR